MEYGPNQATKEHVKPLHKGGEREFANEVMACFTCNNGRNRLDAFFYHELVEKHGRHGAAKEARKIISRMDQHEAKRKAYQSSYVQRENRKPAQFSKGMFRR